jgi:trans-aconitate methyltransferase
MPCNRVLDLGCGTGVLTNEIARFAQKVIGIDSSAAMIEKATAAYPDLDFRIIDACSMQWESCFDVVFSNAVFHFIKTQDVLLKNINRALVKNGVLVCEFGASGNIAGLLNAVACACNRRGKEYELRFYYPTRSEYYELLKSNGFTVESIKDYGLDTLLREGESGLRNWINHVFNNELGWFNKPEREEVIKEIESVLRHEQWDGSNWHLPNRRIQVVARK